MARKTKDHRDRAYEKFTSGAMSRHEFVRLISIAGAAVGLVGGPFGYMTRRAWAGQSVTGTVAAISYMGGEVRYFVDLEARFQLQVINMAREEILRKGHRVALRIDPANCRVLPR